MEPTLKNLLARVGTNDATAATRARYLDPELMTWWLARATVRERLGAAWTALQTAERPQGRFGLQSCPEAVIAICRTALEAASAEAEPVREHIRALRLRGLAWDEVWGQIDRSTGFGPGDAQFLGVLHVPTYTPSPEE